MVVVKEGVRLSLVYLVYIWGSSDQTVHRIFSFYKLSFEQLNFSQPVFIKFVPIVCRFLTKLILTVVLL